MKTSRFKKTAVMFFAQCMFLACAAGAQNAASPEIASVSFQGAKVIPEDRLNEIISTKPSGLFRKKYLSPFQLKRDVNAIQYVYQQQGYLDAVVHVVQELNKENNSVAVTFEITEGDPTIVENISFLGNSAFPDSLLENIIEFKVDNALSIDLLNASDNDILNFYSDRGYIDVEVNHETRINNEQNLAMVDFVITEHEQAVIDSIIIIGLVKTREYIVTRELTFKSGEIVNVTGLFQAEHDLYMLGIFQSVYIRPEPSPSGGGKKNIVVTIQELKTGEIGLSIGYGTFERTRFQIETYENNLFGTTRKAGLTGRLSSLQRLAQVSTSAPRFLGTRWLAEASLILSFQKEPGYDFLRRGGIVSVGRNIFSTNTRLTMYYRHENDDLKNVNTEILPSDFTPHIRSLRVSILHDSRNNLFNPTRGNYLETSSELGRFQSGANFIRFITTTKFFYSFDSGTILGTSFTIGWIGTSGGLAAIPLQERFYSGGPNTVRGFDYQKLGPLDAGGEPIGGEMEIVWNVLEIRRNIYWKFSGVAFLDAGNVWTDSNQFKLFNLRYVGGVGLRMNSPIGFLRVDYGRKIERKPGEAPDKLYFSVGQAF